MTCPMEQRMYGLWTVVADVGRASNGSRLIRCKCACGRVRDIGASELRNGRTRGCSRCRRMTHGHSADGHTTPEYNTWAHMVRRCSDPTSKDWRNYGGRGIKVWLVWQHSFAAFLGSVGPRPSASHSIDRINNDGNYEPGNVRWATRTEQNRNQRERARPLTEALDHHGLKYWTYRARRKRGWSHERALTTPLRGSDA
jgi:hypothetical protein